MIRNKTVRAVKMRHNMQIALELRMHGYSFERIGRALNPSVSRQHAWRLVDRALKELESEFKETNRERVQLEHMRLNRMICALDPRSSEPRVVLTLLKISDRICKLYGLDPPKRIVVCEPNGTAMTPKTEKLDLTKLTFEELNTLERLQAKMAGKDSVQSQGEAQHGNLRR